MVFDIQRSSWCFFQNYNLEQLNESCYLCFIRTAFYVLGLVANTCNGADLLHDYGWEAVRHKHNDLWPVINLSEPQSEADVTMDTITTTTSTSSLPSIRDPSPQHSTNNVFYLDGENGQKSRYVVSCMLF